MATDESIAGKPYFSVAPSALNDATTYMANVHGLAIEIYSLSAGIRVAFKAFLTEFTDNFDTQLDTIFHVGQPQPIRIQKSVDRSITIGIDIPSYSVEEAKFNLRNISLLSKMLYPLAQEVESGLDDVPKSTQVIAGGDPIFKVKFANLVLDGANTPFEDSKNFASAASSGQTGYLDDVSYEFDLDQGFHTDWKTHSKDGGTGFDNFIYPKLIKLSFTFYPLLEKTPVWLVSDFDSEKPTTSFTNQNYPFAYQAIAGESDKIDKLLKGAGNLTTTSINAADEARMKKALNSK